MKKRKRKSRGSYVGLLVIFGLIVGAISFGISYSRQKMDLKTSEQIEEKELEIQNTELKDYDIHSFINEADDIFLESFYGPSDIIELDEIERENLAGLFNNLELTYVTNGNNKDISYLYAVHIKNKNIKLKLSERFIFIESPEEVTLYTLEDNVREDFITKLEELYMSKYNNQDMFQDIEAIRIIAQDANIEWDLEVEKIEAIVRNLYLIAPISSSEISGVPRDYPNYLLKVKADGKDYSIQIINDTILSIDFSDSILYYKYDNKLWNYINKDFPINNKHTSSDFEFLLQSARVVVDAEDDNYDMEDENFYPVEIPRYIISAEKNPLENPLTYEKLIFTMEFYIKKEKHMVEVYENQIIFNGQAYYSKNIGEAIKSLLTV